MAGASWWYQRPLASSASVVTAFPSNTPIAWASIATPELARRLPILYGGSVKPANAAELLGQEDVDGALVGGASLDGGEFAAIVEAAASNA